MSGSSVRISTTTSPVTPWALTTRPTTRSMCPLLVGVHHVDADAPTADAGNQSAQRGRGSTTTADDLAEIVGVHVHLDGAAAAAGHHVDPDIVGVVHDPANQVLDGVDDDRAHGGGQLSVAPATVASTPSAAASDSSLAPDGSAVASASTAARAASSPTSSAVFLAGAFFFLGVVASVLGPPWASASAALNRSSLLGLGSLTFRVPSAPGKPLNFCQSPVIFSSCRTGSVGWAPTDSQYWARSESISMRLGSSFGWYRPMTSIE